MTVLQVVSVDGRTGHINWRYDPDGVVFAYPARTRRRRRLPVPAIERSLRHVHPLRR